MTASASGTSPCDEALARWCERWPLDLSHDSARVAVAYSGGADSSALLRAAVRHWPGRVVALHVHHGLQAAADDFEQHARQTCEVLATPLSVVRVQAAHAPGESPEDAARRARYAALAEMGRAAQAELILLGQHADDQAETVLLALSRGAGLPGLSGMGERMQRHGMAFGRPLLAIHAQALRDELAAAGHAFVDDPSNLDTRFTRNRIRATLAPAWAEAFPGFREALARTARHAAQAQTLLTALAEDDLRLTGAPPSIVALQALSRERQANVLRHWLRQQAGVAASEAQLRELLDQVQVCRTRGHRIRIKVASGHVCLVDQHLMYTASI